MYLSQRLESFLLIYVLLFWKLQTCSKTYSFYPMRFPNSNSNIRRPKRQQPKEQFTKHWVTSIYVHILLPSFYGGFPFVFQMNNVLSQSITAVTRPRQVKTSASVLPRKSHIIFVGQMPYNGNTNYLPMYDNCETALCHQWTLRPSGWVHLQHYLKLHVSECVCV